MRHRSLPRNRPGGGATWHHLRPMPMLDLRSLLLAALIGVALALASCGGGGGSTSPRQFQTEANQVCRDAQQQFDRIASAPTRTADQAAKQAAALVSVSQQALSDLRDVHPPPGLKSVYDRYLAARDRGIGFIQQARDAAANNDATAYARAKVRVSAQQPIRRQLALQLGLHSCSLPTVAAGRG